MRQVIKKSKYRLLWVFLAIMLLPVQAALALVTPVAGETADEFKKDSQPSEIGNPSRPSRYYISAELMKKCCTALLDSKEDRLIITTGDTIFLTNFPTKNMQKNAKYIIYKYMKKRLPKAGQCILEWYEEVGWVKIIENHDKISIGRVIAARDIIHQGDIVYLGTKK